MLPRSFAVFALGATLVGCSSNHKDSDKQTADTPSGQATMDGGVLITDSATGTGKRADGGGLGTITVGSDSPACSANLPFHPPGCPCGDGEEEVSCWSGAPGDRNRGRCHDGKQQCSLAGEFRAWGACTGEEIDCGDTGDAGTPDDCSCVPGTKILCSEDCEQLIICSLTGTKTCQPDGTFGPCTEEFLAGLDGVVACKNLYYKCLFNNEGIYVGDCDSTFTCGHPPGLPPLDAPPDDTMTPSDAGTGPAVIQ